MIICDACHLYMAHEFMEIVDGKIFCKECAEEAHTILTNFVADKPKGNIIHLNGKRYGNYPSESRTIKSWEIQP